jgi:hypothetical protein
MITQRGKNRKGKFNRSKDGTTIPKVRSEIMYDRIILKSTMKNITILEPKKALGVKLGSKLI